MSESLQHTKMKALEMEEEEVERFLDEIDGSMSSSNSASMYRRGGEAGVPAIALSSSSSSSSSNMCKVLAALVVIVIVVSITYLQAEKQILMEDEQNLNDIDIGNSNGISNSHSNSKSNVAKTDAATNYVPPSVDPSSDSDPKSFLYSKLSAIPPDYESLPISADTRAELTASLGKWKFFDGDEDNRPVGDYCGKYPNRDMPGEDFPESAWQGDAVFVNHLVDAAEQLIPRAKEAIFTEYGHGKPLAPEQLVERLKGFKWTLLEPDENNRPKNMPEDFQEHGTRGAGGWTSKRSQKGLVRRLLHAIMSNDNFVIVVAGHSTAAGHGGHFHQSYSMQLHRILAPVFARLGVKLVTRNMSQGGMGTIHNALGFRDLYGDDIDVLIWDSAMTEPELPNVDFLFRQAILSGNSKVPLIWTGASVLDVAWSLHQAADVDIGEFGTGMETIAETTSAEQVKTLPFAVQYMKCSGDGREVCHQNSRFCARCWIPRNDLDPQKLFDTINQDDEPGGQVSWHLGWREHRLLSRVLAMALLDGLQQAFQVFSEGTMGGPPLDDSHWHVSDYYENIRNKVRNLDPSVGACSSLKERNLPPRICSTVMKGRSLHTPRYKPAETSLLNLIRAAPNGYKPSNQLKMAYEGADAHNPCYDIPPGQVDVYAIVSGRRRHRQLTAGVETDNWWQEEREGGFPPGMMSMQVDSGYAALTTGGASADAATVSGFKHSGAANNATTIMTSSSSSSSSLSRRRRHLESSSGIVPGIGWELDHVKFYEKPGQCDGNYYSFCGRLRTDDCPLLGHHDSRGTLVGNALSGWLVMDIPDVEHGLILIRIIPWLEPAQSTITQGWTTENNGRQRRRRQQQQQERQRKASDASNLRNGTFSSWQDAEQEALRSSSTRGLKAPFSYPDDLQFQFAINGKITTWDKDTFVAKKASVQQVTDVWTLLDDPQWPSKGPVELAIRLQGCQNRCTFGIPQVYWA